jgi:hypothetical protein
MANENSELKALVVKSAMRKMMQQGYFDICTVDKCLDLLGIAPVNEAYKMLRTLHCVNYNAMEPAIQSALPRLLSDTFDGIDIEAMLGATPSAKQLAEKAGFWKRLTSGGGEA